MLKPYLPLHLNLEIAVIRKILFLFTPQERKQAGVLLGLIIVVAILDMLGVASIMPFIAVLAKPELVETNAILKNAYAALSHFGVDTREQFLFALGICVFMLLIGSLAFKALNTYALLRFTLMREYSIGKRLVEGYLRQPYSWFLNRHSADLGKNVLSEVSAVINQSISPIMNLIAQSAVAIALLILLIVVDPKLALIVGITLATAYGLIFKITKGLLARMGVERLNANKERFIAVVEAFGAIKEVKVGGLENAYIRRFAVPAQKYARHESSVSIISQLPRFALEGIAFGGMLLVMLYLMAENGNFASALPIVALYALAGYRLMPALQQIYAALTRLNFAGAALDALHKDLMSLQLACPKTQYSKLNLNQAITLNNIFYRYPNADTPALKGISLSIPAKSTVGLVGATGSGKTTLVDLILGLLDPQEGAFDIGGQPITDHNKRAWQQAIGYVPQQIYLADDTVAANIAFGIEPNQVDQVALERAAKIANLHEFVTSDLPHAYATMVGERGVRLSGGQRQRIGIARALYHAPQVLILDEATSALDSRTEQAVMEAVHNIGHEITIILIAHRLSTVKQCDMIYLLEKGELRGQGTFEDLMQSNAQFRDMAVT